MRKASLLIIIMAFAISTSYARSFKYVYKDVTFKCNEERGGITITSFDDDADIVVIPGFIDGVPVKKVSCFINGHNYMASEIVIEEGVEEIAKFCFNEFRQLYKVTLPSTIYRINSNAFRKNNDIIFYGPENFDVALVRGYTSRPFNGKVSQAQERLLAKNNTNNVKKQKHQEEVAENALIMASHQQQELLAQNSSSPKNDNEVSDTKNEKKRKKGVGNMLSQILGKNNGGGKQEIAQDVPDQTTAVVQSSPVTEGKKRSRSDVDINIPRSKKINESTFCFIIANEKYDELPIVNYAENDGNTFKEYCVNTLGVPESQVFLYVNASYTSMMRAFRKMESLASATNGKSKFVFYYAGHGSPSEEDQAAHIVPSDGLVTVPSTCFALSDLYKLFGKMEAESVVVLLDACFSGLNRDNSGLIAARSVARKPIKETITGNVIVLSATSEAETAMGYDEKGHGMFTYHVLKKLQQTNGEVKFSDLYQAVSEGVRRDAIIKNDKNQTPSIAVSSTLIKSWESMGF